MEIRTLKSLFIAAVLLFGLVLATPVPSESQQDKGENAEAKPIVIKSNTLEVKNDDKMVIFTGDVNAKSDDFIIECQKMLVFYENQPDQEKTGEGATKIDRIVATGQVRITRTEGGFATAEKAVYYQKDEKVVLTEKPVVRQGNDLVEGERVTIFLKEKRSVVDSTEDKKVRAIIFPKSEER
jgi:lipopolysaccharide export system protein LptA